MNQTDQMKRFRLNSHQEMGKDYRMRDLLPVKTEKPQKLLGGVLTGHLLEAGNVSPFYKPVSPIKREN